MSPSLKVQISDVFGLGKLADSAAALRLVEAITSGTGRLAGPWLLRREVHTQLELQKLAEKELSQSFSGEMSLSDRATLNLKFQALSRQQNREEIARLSIEKARSEDEPENCSGRFSEDWLNHYWKLAEGVSHKKMQELWAYVLAKESAQPGSVSLRTLDVLRAFSLEEALEIQRLASYVVRVLDKWSASVA